ncbi:MAG: type I-C CRISPR-associated protein Cas7/Csd2 [Candidatus Limiplasma sp.]|nr:type I-C CRISPR-associated protein Cas7/Csd2 [Candidatus Limiplasma sp.]
MAPITHKIDFAVILSVRNANPNGDPLNGNRPRENYDGFGEISDVCLKRKIRNRLMDEEMPVLVQAEDHYKWDKFPSIAARVAADPILKKETKKGEFITRACEKWLDVRAFGQVFAFKSLELASAGVRGPVTVQSAYSVDIIDIESIQITKSANGETSEKRGSDTMGMKHRVPFGVYVSYGSINCQLAERTGFSDADAQAIHDALISLFENDASSARPEGSMEVVRVYWWEHSSKLGQYSSAKVHRSLRVQRREGVASPRSFEEGYEAILTELPGLTPQIDDGR